MAEQLEHIQSDKLISRLDRYLGHPDFDPHGDPIPDENGNVKPSGTNITVLNKENFDNSIIIDLGEKQVSLSNKITDNLYVKKEI